jgi:O-antigen/teichoic acid export membrane protein
MKRRIVAASRLLAASSYLKNTLALISGTVVTQAIVFLFSPLLSRIFELEDFGNLANYNAWVAILALISSFRYEHAIIVAKDRENTNKVIALTTTLSLVSFLVYVAIACGIAISHPVGGYLRNIHGIILFIPFGVLFACVSSLLIQLNIKQGNFKRLAVVAAVQVVFTVVPQIALGILKIENGLIIGTIVGFVFSAVVLSKLSLDRQTVREMRDESGIAVLRTTARQYINFPRYTLGADAISIVAQQFVPVFVLALFNPAVAGLYSFSIRVVRVPLIVVSTAIAGALRKEAVDRLKEEGTLTPLFTVTVRTLLFVAFFPFVVMLLYSNQIFAAVFGHKWADAGKVVQILSPGILVEFVAFPLSIIFLVTNTQRYTFAIQLVGFGALSAALFVGKHFLNDFMSTCYLISAVMILVNLASIALAAKVSRRSIVRGIVLPRAEVGPRPDTI